MPVEIKNLVIMIHVGDEANTPANNGSNKQASQTTLTINEDIKQQLIIETVQQVLEILQRQKER